MDNFSQDIQLPSQKGRNNWLWLFSIYICGTNLWIRTQIILAFPLHKQVFSSFLHKFHSQVFPSERHIYNKWTEKHLKSRTIVTYRQRRPHWWSGTERRWRVRPAAGRTTWCLQRGRLQPSSRSQHWSSSQSLQLQEANNQLN